MSHAPGASGLGPRLSLEDTFSGKVLGTLAKTIGRDKKDGRGQAGVGALKRTLQANERASRAREERRKARLDETLDGASKHIGGEGGQVVVGGRPAEPEPQPGFFSLLPGALTTPLRGWLVTFLHTLIVALALLLLELSPGLGLVACLLAGIELLGFRTRLVQDACAGRTHVRWPDAGMLGGTLLIAGVASLWCLWPGVGLGLAAWGRPAFEVQSQDSLIGRAKRIVAPNTPGAEGLAFGHHTLLELEAISAPRLGSLERGTAQVRRDFQEGALATLRSLGDVDRASPLGLGARVLLLLGFLLYPMSALCAIRLRSVYAAIYPPIVIRSALTVPGSYLFVLLATLLYAAGFVAGLVFGLPLLHAQLGETLGHFAWIVGFAAYVVVGHMTLAGLLGRVYRSGRFALGWD